MHLKKLQLSGFKSFADKVSLTFDRGITGVVGPNGCGKSNIIDSVRWVMGEQNAKHLRGEQATDIIFSGSEKRKGLGMAEVSLTFDNSEDNGFCPPEYRHEQEITLQRRLYIDGQREYLINRKPCRLKDIVNFFTTTGLGGRGYSMIQQGQVDRILNAKPEDVREILEEAAGTLVYKKRKVEALKKLEAAGINLSRIEDILTELARQKESLSEQVEKAKKWQELSDALKEAEVYLLSHNYKHFSDELKKLEDEIGDVVAKESEVIKELTHFEARQEELQSLLDREAPKLQALREEISQLREDIARKESAILNFSSKEESSLKYINQVQEQIDELTETKTRLEEQRRTAQEKYETAKASVSENKEKIETLNFELNTIDESYHSYANKKEELEEQLKTLERLLDNNSLRKETAERDIEKAALEKTDTADRIELLKEDLTEAKTWLDEAEARVANEKEGLDKELRAKHEIEAFIAERISRQEEIKLNEEKNKESYFQIKAKLDSLRELETNDEQREETFEKIKSIANCETPFLSDHIHVIENTSISNAALAAFDSWLNGILIPDVDTLNKINLDSQGLLNFNATINRSENSHEISSVAEWAQRYPLRKFNDFITIDNDPEGKIAAALEGLYYLNSDEISSSLTASIPNQVTVISKSGFIINNTYRFEFRGSSESKGKISREFEIKKLEANLIQISDDLDNSKQLLDAINLEIESKRAQLSQIDETLDSQNRQVLELLGDVQSCQQTYDHKKQLLETAEKDLVKFNEAEEHAKAELRKIKDALTSITQDQEITAEELNSLKAEFSGLDARREEILRQSKSQEIALASLEANLTSYQETFERLDVEFNDVLRREERRNSELAKAREEIDSAKTESIQAQETIEVLIRQREVKENELTDQQDEHASTIEELKVIDNKLREYRDFQSKSQRDFGEKKMAIERAKLVIENAVTQAIEEYQLDLSQYQFEVDPEFDSANQSKKISRLKSSIEAMGLINMMAIQEYNQLIEREDFITEQKDEVLASINLLTDAIDEIAVTSEKKYMATYHAVNEEFQNLFPVLFPRGEAKLVLTDEDDPLEGGLEIMVRLPGKKHQPLKLFSGGEKALTAISLIFALLKTKPTPFCFLDEVDAPLDEANVGRFNRVLEALSDRFQFVIITHNRRTMEVLDTLYGITMQEPGVSKVVGVDMNKDIPKHLRKSTSPEVQGATAH